MDEYHQLAGLLQKARADHRLGECMVFAGIHKEIGPALTKYEASLHSWQCSRLTNPISFLLDVQLQVALRRRFCHLPVFYRFNRMCLRDPSHMGARSECMAMAGERDFFVKHCG